MKRAGELVWEREMEVAGIAVPKVQREVAQTPLVDLLERWLETGLSPEVTKKHRTYSRNRSLRAFEGCGWRFVRDITPEAFEMWRASERRRGVKPKTLNEYLAHVRSFLKWMEERGMIGANPLRMLKPLRVVRGDGFRAFTFEEFGKLVASAPPYRACVYIFAAFTGLRRDELKTLEWSRVTLAGENSRLDLSAARTKNRKGGILPLHPDAVAVLEVLRGMAPEGGRPVFYKGVTQIERYRMDLAAAGIAEFDALGRRLDFHSLRRSLATFLGVAGVEPQYIKELMRHSELRLTMGVYTDHSQLPLAAAVRKIPSLGPSLISSLFSGKSCPRVSKAGKVSKSEGSSEPAESEAIRVGLGAVVQPCPGGEMADGGGFEPPVPFGYTRFPGVPVKPLWHPSGKICPPGWRGIRCRLRGGGATRFLAGNDGAKRQKLRGMQLKIIRLVVDSGFQV